MRARLIVMGILIAILLATGAVSLALGASVPDQEAIRLKSSELAGQSLTTKETDVRTGGVITLTLGASVANGRWEEQAEVSDPSIVEQTHNKMLLPESRGIEGEQHSQSWTFRTLKEGSTTVRVQSEPTQGSQQEARTFEMTLVVVQR